MWYNIFWESERSLLFSLGKTSEFSEVDEVVFEGKLDMVHISLEGWLSFVASSLDQEASPRLQHMGLTHFALPMIVLLIVSYAFRKFARYLEC